MTGARQVPGIIDPYAYPPRGLDLAAAARYVGLDPTAFLALVEDGKLPHPRRLGDAEVWDRMALDTAFEVPPIEQEPVPPTPQEPGRKDARKRRAPPMMSKEYPGHNNAYTPETLSERWRCSAQHVRNMVKRGDLAGSMLGGRLLRISAAVVAAYENTDTGKVRGR